MHNVADLDLFGKDGTFHISANFVAPTLGYRVSLDPIIYVVEPNDKIQEFVLSVTPPSGPYTLPALQVFPLGGSLPAWAEGARIRGSSLDHIASIRGLVKEGDPIGDDMYFLEAVCVNDDKLIADVRYGGGIARHDFRPSWDSALDKSNPPKATLYLSHNGNNDTGKAIIPERLTFDLSPYFDSGAEVDFVIATQVDQRAVPRCAS
ncbi:MAG: hypothetical protein QNI87_12885 [Erythrobacter sp.]|uniref:hypothetical protein n=1 Tax=Erythrobacter sp. TaxID=1042 RepID=UPI00262016DF|nr:hypothetical protein [Erythrobacter sp.]MDJ0979414.1 hypothetical protein [Erythrobacter sp.]